MPETNGGAADQTRDEGGIKSLISSYVDFMKIFHDRFPNGALIVWGGVALFLGVAIVGKISTNENSQHIAAFYYLLYGSILLLIGKLLMYDLLIKIFGWILVFSIFHWVVLFDVHLVYPGRTQLACVVYFWKTCDSVAAETAGGKANNSGTSAELDPRIRMQIESTVSAQLDAMRQKSTGADTSRNPPLPGTEVKPPAASQIQPVPPAASQVQPVPPADKARFKVFLQFAGSYKREEMVNFAARLVKDDWHVEGADFGGERTRVAIGYNEVRHPPGEGEAEARSLAAFIDGLKIAPRPMKAVASGGVDAKTLEIYVSN